MKKEILAGAAAFGLSVLVAGVGPAFAGGGGGLAPQEHWASPYQHEEALETGTLAPSDAGKRAVESGVKTSEYEMAKGAGTGNILPESGIVPE